VGDAAFVVAIRIWKDGAEAGGGGDHWRVPCVDRLDDLGVVDALQVDRGDPEVGMPQLSLDEHKRHAFAGHLDSVRAPQLMGLKPAPDPASSSGMSELAANG
jgi:hypothetical protein